MFFIYHTEFGKLTIHGQDCDHCVPKDHWESCESRPDCDLKRGCTSKTHCESKVHSINYAVDGSPKWWQSPPLSRGQQYEKINITLDLGQVRFFYFHSLHAFVPHTSTFSCCTVFVLQI